MIFYFLRLIQLLSSLFFFFFFFFFFLSVYLWLPSAPAVKQLKHIIKRRQSDSFSLRLHFHTVFIRHKRCFDQNSNRGTAHAVYQQKSDLKHCNPFPCPSGGAMQGHPHPGPTHCMGLTERWWRSDVFFLFYKLIKRKSKTKLFIAVAKQPLQSMWRCSLLCCSSCCRSWWFYC